MPESLSAVAKGKGTYGLKGFEAKMLQFARDNEIRYSVVDDNQTINRKRLILHFDKYIDLPRRSGKSHRILSKLELFKQPAQGTAIYVDLLPNNNIEEQHGKLTVRHVAEVLGGKSFDSTYDMPVLLPANHGSLPVDEYVGLDFSNAVDYALYRSPIDKDLQWSTPRPVSVAHTQSRPKTDKIDGKISPALDFGTNVAFKGAHKDDETAYPGMSGSLLTGVDDRVLATLGGARANGDAYYVTGPSLEKNK